MGVNGDVYKRQGLHSRLTKSLPRVRSVFSIPVPAFLILRLIFLHGIQRLPPVIFQADKGIFKIHQNSTRLSLKLYKVISQAECGTDCQGCKTASRKLHIQKYGILLITAAISVMDQILPFCIYPVSYTHLG